MARQVKTRLVSFLTIFDCDGVLVDSEFLEHGVDAELLGPLGYAASAQELLQRFVGIARADMPSWSITWTTCRRRSMTCPD